MAFDAFELQGQDEDGHFQNVYLEFMQNHGNFDDSFIEKKKAKTKKKKQTLDEFIGDSNEETLQIK